MRRPPGTSGKGRTGSPPSSHVYIYQPYKDKNIIYYIYIYMCVFHSLIQLPFCQHHAFETLFSLKKKSSNLFIYLLKNHLINHTALAAKLKENNKSGAPASRTRQESY